MSPFSLTIGTILLVILFIIPGAIFLTTISRWIFPSGRENFSRVGSVVFSIILSIIILTLFDREISRELYGYIFTKLNSFGLVSSELITFFNENQLLKKVIEVATTSSKDNNFDESVYYLFTIAVFGSFPFSFLLSIFAALTLKLINSLMHARDIMEFLTYIVLSISESIRLVWQLRHSFNKWVDKNAEPWVKEIYYDAIQFFTFFGDVFIGAIKLVIPDIIQFLLVILTAIWLVGALLIVILVLAIIIFAIDKLLKGVFLVLSLFQHPLYRNFFDFDKRFKTPLIEIHRNDKVLIKGVLRNFEPLNRNQLASISVSNVIQYKLKSDSELFIRGNRKAYVFNDNNNLLTIPASSILDFNLWYLGLDGDNWKIKVVDENSLKSQVWYLNLIISKNRSMLRKISFDIFCESKYFYKLQNELVKIIDENFSRFPYRARKKKLLKELFRDALQYKSLMKKELTTFSFNIIEKEFFDFKKNIKKSY